MVCRILLLREGRELMVRRTKPSISHCMSEFITGVAVALRRSCIVTILTVLPVLFFISTSVIVVVVGVIILAVFLVVVAALILVVVLVLVLVLAIIFVLVLSLRKNSLLYLINRLIDQ